MCGDCCLAMLCGVGGWQRTLVFGKGQRWVVMMPLTQPLISKCIYGVGGDEDIFRNYIYFKWIYF